MRVGFAVNKIGTSPIPYDDLLVFFSSVPIVLQPSEIKRVQTGVHLRIERGYVLNIITDKDLYEKGVSIFPGTLSLNSSFSGELLIPLHNLGRNQVNLQEKSQIAWGHVIKAEPITLEAIVLEEASKKKDKSTPPKKNPDIKFEIR